jgi:hypothetical protein
VQGAEIRPRNDTGRLEGRPGDAAKPARAGALRGDGAAADAGGASLLASAGVPVQGAALDGLVDRGDEAAMIGVGRLLVARGDRGLQARK